MIKNNFFLLTLFLIVALCNPSFAEIKKGQWEYVKDSDYCLIQSVPLKTDIPEGKSRGENYLLVYRMKNNIEPIIQLTAGFNYKSPDSISVTIDEKDYNFYSDSDTAWAKEDQKVIKAMKKQGVETDIGPMDVQELHWFLVYTKIRKEEVKRPDLSLFNQ